MRMLPIAFYLQSIYGSEFNEIEEAFEIIHNVSSLTHSHKRSQIACGIYISIASLLLNDNNLKTAIRMGIYGAMKYYKNDDRFLSELKHFERLEMKDFSELSLDEISSSGYVVSTLETAVWCLLNTTNYKDCVLKAVNLGHDTDTVAAVVGGLAGLYYGYQQIPEEWIHAIAKKEYIEDLCDELNRSMYRNGIEKLSTYIPFFENATKESVYTWTKGYPVYDPTLKEFINEVYKTNLMSYNYLDIIDKRGIQGMDGMVDSIPDGDLELLLAILTDYIRQERFGTGLWAEAVEDKVFLSILKRLNYVIN